MSAKRAQTASRSSATHATAVLLEDLRGQIRVVIEAVLGQGEKLRTLDQKLDRVHAELGARIDRVHAELGARIDRVHAELGESIERIRQELLVRIGRLEDAARENSHEIRELREALAGTHDAATLAALEIRVTQLEKRVGIKA